MALKFYSIYRTAIDLGDEPLPINVKRLSPDDYDAFVVEFQRFTAPRGTVERTPEELTAFDADRLVFFERTIREFVTVDPGALQMDDVDVVDGAGLLALFHARLDILVSILAQVYVQNRLAGVQKKTLNWPPASAPGSAASTAVPDGEQPAPTAASVESSSSVPIADATASSASVSSGTADEATTAG